MCSPRTWSFEPDATTNQLRTPQPEAKTSLQLAKTQPDTRSQDQLTTGQPQPDTRSQDQLTIGQPQPDTRSQDQLTTGQSQPQPKTLLLESYCLAARNLNLRKRHCCLKPLPGSKEPQPQPNQSSNYNTAIRKTPTPHRLISCSLLLVSFLLLSFTCCSMAEDGAPTWRQLD